MEREANRGGAPPANVALVVGVTGLVGREIAQLLAARPDWKVYGVARTAGDVVGRHHFIPCDLLDPADAATKLSPLRDVTHVFWVTWASRDPIDGQECVEQNRAMMANALDAILPAAAALKHVTLQTGTKHYISISGPIAEDRVYDEDSPRVAGGRNFYYALEDLLRERLAGGRAGWSVHRPGLLLGASNRTALNFVGSLCVYGALCRHLGLPFRFGGSKMCWEEEYLDISDARLVAAQHAWAATAEEVAEAAGEAFNAVNGRGVTWKAIWPALAAKFGAELPEGEGRGFSPEFTYASAMADKATAWAEMVEKEGLRRTRMGDLANWWFLDALFRCPMKLRASRGKADRFGFTDSVEPTESILYWVDRMRSEKLIP